MKARPSSKITELLVDRRLVEAALATGVRQALVRHLQAGLPAVEWRDGKTVWIGPAEIRRRIAAIDTGLKGKGTRKKMGRRHGHSRAVAR